MHPGSSRGRREHGPNRFVSPGMYTREPPQKQSRGGERSKGLYNPNPVCSVERNEKEWIPPKKDPETMVKKNAIAASQDSVEFQKKTTGKNQAEGSPENVLVPSWQKSGTEEGRQERGDRAPEDSGAGGVGKDACQALEERGGNVDVGPKCLGEDPCADLEALALKSPYLESPAAGQQAQLQGRGEVSVLVVLNLSPQAEANAGASSG